jgi:predicted nicotinamide N-methyase
MNGDPGQALRVLRASLAERLAALRGIPAGDLPPALLDVAVRRLELPGDVEAFYLRPADWEQLRHEEGGAGRPVPYWARPWPAGLALARTLSADPPSQGTRVLELGCGLALPSLVAARAGADVVATDGATDAVAYAAHTMALNEVEATVAHADWAVAGEALAAGGPWDLVLAADVLYTRANVEQAARLLPRLGAAGGEIRLADPGRPGARDLLAAARASFMIANRPAGEGVTVHVLRRRPAG